MINNNISLFFRNKLVFIPPYIGKALSYIPFNYRPGIGAIYRKQATLIEQFIQCKPSAKEAIILKLFKAVCEFAYSNIEFYKELYASNGFHPNKLITFDDIQKVPIINKTLLNEYNLTKRSCVVKGRYQTNTGGSTGNTLNFFVTADMMGNEWAHIHKIWSLLNYRPSDLKLVFIGVNGEKNKPLKYDFARNSFLINIYAPENEVAEAIKKVMKKYEIKYLHGYPSALYNFSSYCGAKDEFLLESLKRTLKGAFLGSEFPVPIYREMIESTFNIKTISWYGHTERCILAYEKNTPFVYSPFQSYGYAEAISLNGISQLVGTSYYNFASPMIRYNTEDEINNLEFSGAILDSFRIDGGRTGQFICDKNGKKIPLTGLIFGRHHKLFDYCSHIQVRQKIVGTAEILFVKKKKGTTFSIDPSQLFNSHGIAMDFIFKCVEAPFLTKSGKINLLID